ncbi:BON domain-containing protein [Bathymodiolus septemdierum thioautotrophic gill symbiont]|uniref:Lipoprotein n=1 Tax=endosymbiont of Bathymodiolus septemdierum str. Myojin knoll TaxID=1303921 RepID=A0A0P0UPY6_9GAMM|nr:BON domain-containing protein [Bathymodiolus septemdierum thioautotrophic gill symbiont]BAS67113.1 lipoprotein [endosymbiont of Bathymodiolus septemdierum str. Myojin knoll]
MKKIIYSLIVTASTLFLSSCLLSSALSTAIIVANDRRTTGEIVDDKSIEFNLFAWNDKENRLENAHLNFLVYNKEVLITGEVPTQAVRDYIIKQAPNKDFKIKKVIDELRIAKSSSLLSRAKDSMITIKAKALFHNQEVFNPLHIEITTENRTIYLMGDLTRREANKATKIASGISGVKRIVKLFHYLENIPAGEIARAKQKELEAERKKALEVKRATIEAKKAELRRQINALDPNGGTSF